MWASEFRIVINIFWLLFNLWTNVMLKSIFVQKRMLEIKCYSNYHIKYKKYKTFLMCNLKLAFFYILKFEFEYKHWVFEFL